ncbi:MAG TPA: ATP-binding protein [Longimicrobiales bacterium]|nr:ATP-binding protein [Longimicrobiales bacterium]
MAAVFAGALLVAALGIIVLVPRLDSVVSATAYVAALLILDLTVFAAFGRYLLRKKVLAPLDQLVRGAEAIAAGDYSAAPTAAGDTAEMLRLTRAFNQMAERLIAHRQQLAENVRSLELTNRQLTEARDELVRAEKMASVGRLGAGIAHEVGNPLGAIMGYLAVIRRIANDSRCEEYVAAAEAEARRIDRIVSGLLDYARPKETKVRPTSVGDIIERTLALLQGQGVFGNTAVAVDVAADLPLVEADPHRLQQVFVNLLLNARDATQEREQPRITIRATRTAMPAVPDAPARRRDDPPDVDYSHRRRFHRLPQLMRDVPRDTGGDLVAIEFKDNGTGIPASLIDQVFEPFVTTKNPGQGTGLGLAVCARLVDAMGGTIRVESREDEGATFTVVLPGLNEEAYARTDDRPDH